MTSQDEAATDAAVGPIGRSDAHPRNLLGVESLVLGLGLKAASSVIGTASSELLAYLRREGPTTHQVIDSSSDEKGYSIFLKIHNLTAHGVYIDKIFIKNLASDVKLDIVENKAMGWAASTSSSEIENYFPRYIQPLDDVDFTVRLEDNKFAALAESNVVELRYSFTLVGGDGVDTNHEGVIAARLRHIGAKSLAQGQRTKRAST